MPLQATSGAASYDAFGGGVPVEPNYIESVFSTFLYTGNGSTQTITNGIDLAGEGGLVWTKARSAAYSNALTDTVRGASNGIYSNTTQAQGTSDVSSFTSTGFGLTFTDNTGNRNDQNYASWTFRKQPKFFDVVTYTGNGVAGRTVAHNLGSAPGCIIVKNITTSGTEWPVYHRGIADSYLSLNTTNANSAAGAKFVWGNDVAVIPPTDTVFTVGGANAGFSVNRTGEQYVAYLFAHNAGGFGLTGTDNVISCGGFTTSSFYATVNLGYEPQWILYKRTDSTVDGDWQIADNMRGLLATANSPFQGLQPNLPNAEASAGNIQLTSTGFVFGGASASPYIYIAIRRGPMRTPTTGTSVFNTALRTTGNPNFVAGFPVDMSIYALRSGAAGTPLNISRLTNTILVTSDTSAQVANDPSLNYDQQLGYGSGQSTNSNVLSWMWRRAPGFFDVVCYTVSGFAANNVAHNLTVTPELFITKPRGSTGGWTVYGSVLGSTNNYMTLNADTALQTSGAAVWGATATTFSDISTVANGTYVAYLFASVPGVSKVFNFTGNGSSQTINCGFTGGARFVMVKRTDSTGNWMVADTARGLVAAGDPTLYLNSTAAEVTGVDWIDPDSSGFIVNQEGTMNANVNGATYIGIAIA